MKKAAANIYSWLLRGFADFRIVLGLFGLLLLPLFISMASLYSQFEQLSRLKGQMEQLKGTSARDFSFKNHFRSFSNEYGDADHFYLDKELEPLIFLKSEIDMLERLLEHPAFSQSEAIQKRLGFLKSGNRLLFAEEARRSSAKFYEVEEKQLNPVEIGKEDLKSILLRIEGTAALKKPQLIIREFELQRKPLGSKGELYSLNLSLIKREVQRAQ